MFETSPLLPKADILRLKPDFKGTRKASWTERELGPAELTIKGTLYQVGPKAPLLRRTYRRAATLLPNKFWLAMACIVAKEFLMRCCISLTSSFCCS